VRAITVAPPARPILAAAAVIVVALPEGHFMQLAVTFEQAETEIQLSVITSQM
jgi:hypothetical protein